MSELERFLHDKLVLRTTPEGATVSYIDQPLRWWREHGQVAYPTLARLALDLFAMPGMSSECERAFSAAKRMITDERYRLKYDVIEADQCVKSWFKHGLVDGRAAFTTIAGDDDEGAVAILDD